MTKRILALAAALLLLFSACNSSSSSIPERPVVLTPGTTLASIETDPVQSNVEFVFSDLEEFLFTMCYDPPYEAKTQYSLGLNIPDGYDCEWLGDTEVESLFEIIHYDTSTLLANVKLTTGPVDVKQHYQTEDENTAKELMAAEYFTTENVYQGLKKAVVEDFGYDLVVDVRGKAFGCEAYYMEFLNGDTRSIRYFMSNDRIDDRYYSFEFRADLPDKDTDRIWLAREILFSMHEMGGSAF